MGSKENDFKAEKASSPKYTEELVNTPQTIVVIKKELIEQQGALTLTDALRNTPGVGTFFLGENGNTNTGDAVYMRGFDSSGSIYVDGVRDVGSISRDVFNIEQIDVLKGPAGTTVEWINAPFWRTSTCAGLLATPWMLAPWAWSCRACSVSTCTPVICAPASTGL